MKRERREERGERKKEMREEKVKRREEEVERREERTYLTQVAPVATRDELVGLRGRGERRERRERRENKCCLLLAILRYTLPYIPSPLSPLPSFVLLTWSDVVLERKEGRGKRREGRGERRERRGERGEGKEGVNSDTINRRQRRRERSPSLSFVVRYLPVAQVLFV